MYFNWINKKCVIIRFVFNTWIKITCSLEPIHIIKPLLRWSVRLFLEPPPVAACLCVFLCSVLSSVTETHAPLDRGEFTELAIEEYLISLPWKTLGLLLLWVLICLHYETTLVTQFHCSTQSYPFYITASSRFGRKFGVLVLFVLNSSGSFWCFLVNFYLALLFLTVNWFLSCCKASLFQFMKVFLHCRLWYWYVCFLESFLHLARRDEVFLNHAIILMWSFWPFGCCWADQCIDSF